VCVALSHVSSSQDSYEFRDSLHWSNNSGPGTLGWEARERGVGVRRRVVAASHDPNDIAVKDRHWDVGVNVSKIK